MARRKPAAPRRKASRRGPSLADLSSRLSRLEIVIVEMRRDLRTQFQRIAQLQAQLDRIQRQPL